MIWVCPLCRESLVVDQSQLTCSNGHCFDVARQGYVNLLPVQKKHSKQPGDSKSMIQARNQFLKKGFYQPLADTIFQKLENYFCTSAFESDDNVLRGLDIGGGDGYFSHTINQLALSAGQLKIDWWLSDISKEAVKLAARQFPTAQTAVANSLDLPLAEQSVDCLLQAFSPASDEEAVRILKRRGIWIRVYPGPKHLYEMRSKIFTQAQAHKPWPDPKHFKLLTRDCVNFSFKITTKEERSDLLSMTPMVWRSNRDNQEQWLNSDISHVTADFVVACFERTDG